MKKLLLRLFWSDIGKCLEKTAILFICTLGNPLDAVISKEQIKRLIELSDQYGFIIVSDECYPGLWCDKAPIVLLEVCAELGRDDYKTVLFFTLYLSVLTYRVHILDLWQVIQNYFNVIFNIVPITVQQCLFSINLPLLQRAMMKRKRM